VALGATSCEVYTDVDGVYTADPRVVPEARVLATVPVGVMAEMAFSGAKVMHNRAVELAAARGMDIVVRSSSSYSVGTTIVGRSSGMIETDGFVVAVTHDLDVAGLTVCGREASPDLVTEVLSAVARVSVPVDMVSWSASGHPEGTLRFAVRHSRLADAVGAVRSAIGDRGWEVAVAEDVGTLSLVGVGLHSRPEYTVQMLGVLARTAVPAMLFSSTQSRVSVVVPRDRVVDGVVALHRAFALDRPATAAELLSSAG
jgi:aspartate kinase